MQNSIRIIILAVLLIIIQGITDNYLNLTIYINIALLPFILLILPYRCNSVCAMVIAFCLGFIVDLFSNGIIGMSAAALTAAAGCRNWIIRLTVNKETIEKEKSPSYTELGLSSFTVYATFFLFIYFLIYFLIDSVGFRPFGFNLLRLTVSLAINVLLMDLLFITTRESRR